MSDAAIWVRLHRDFNAHTLAVFTLEDEQIVWTDKSSGIWPSDVNLSRTVVDFFVSTDKSSWKNRLSRPTNIRRFARRKICSSRLHIRRTSDDLFVQTFCSLTVFTLEDEQIVWHLTVWCELVSYCRRLVRLDGQVVWEKSSFQTDKFQTIFSLRNLFDPFAHQTICSSETICPSRRFVRPLMWKRPNVFISRLRQSHARI